jgi:hypothetical protein
MKPKLMIVTGVALPIGLALLLAPAATASNSTTPLVPPHAATAEKGIQHHPAPAFGDPVLPPLPPPPDAVDPDLYRSLDDQMDAGPPQQLLDNQDVAQRNAMTPPAPPALPQPYTHSDSPCRDFGDTLDHSGAPIIPGGGLVTSLLEHLCLLGSP